MRYRDLNGTSLKLSEIGFGCSGFWGNKYFSELKARQLVECAIENGVNFFDTGHNYSSFYAEPRLGRILKSVFKEVPRNQLIVSSKAGTTMARSSVLQPQAHQSDFSPSAIRASCAESIQNLQCDYLDVFQLHAVSQQQITDELVKELESMKSEGMFRYLGINSHSRSDLEYVAQNPQLFDMVLLDYNLLQQDREPQIRALSEAGVGVVAGTVLAQGHLLNGKLGKIRNLSDLWYLARAWLKPSSCKLMQAGTIFRKEMAKISDHSPLEMAFLYVLNNTDVACCVFGTTRMHHLREVLELSERKLDPEIYSQLRNLYNELKISISS